MSRVTSKLQVTIPKRIADHYAIRPGDSIDWLEAGDAIRVVPEARLDEVTDVARRLELFDAATVRQQARQAERGAKSDARGRGWDRNDLYTRGSAR